MITLFKKKKRDIISLQVLAGICSGCHQCVDRCRRRVFTRAYIDNKEVAAVKYPENCSGCGKCAKRCPSGAIELFLKEI